MRNARAHVVVAGLVQGVFFRATTQEKARESGVRGWVKNNPDGTVEAVFEGDKDQVAELVEWCRQGPPSARVDDLRVSWEDYRGEFDDFTALTRHNTY
ncbi:MAG TPA: acylphosphatase [Gammaproteobacteria bacterium]|nr:acylphosphatase [Gammaproteobacteria bacterium]